MSLANFGAESYKNFVRKFGRVENIATEAICWDGANGYEGWLDTEEDIEWSSNSEADKAGSAGVGAIQFTGQGNDGIERTFEGPINGITWTKLSDVYPVELPKCNTVYTAQALNLEGTNQSPLASEGRANSGTITIRSVTTQKIMAIILPTLGRTQMMIWRCPLDHFAEFDKVSIYPISGKEVVAQLLARDSMEHSWLVVGQIDVLNGIASITHPFPDYVSPGTDICLVIIPGQTGTTVSAQMWIEKKPIPRYEEVLAEESL